jgi:hypothetical protein
LVVKIENSCVWFTATNARVNKFVGEYAPTVVLPDAFMVWPECGGSDYWATLKRYTFK